MSLEPIQKEVFKSMIDYIEEELVGIKMFNPYICEIAFENLEDKKVVKYLNDLETFYFNQIFDVLDKLSISNFLIKRKYKSFSKSILNLQSQYVSYLKYDKKGSSREALLKVHLNYIRELDLYAKIYALI